jgi:hypothetical protein
MKIIILFARKKLTILILHGQFFFRDYINKYDTGRHIAGLEKRKMHSELRLENINKRDHWDNIKVDMREISYGSVK